MRRLRSTNNLQVCTKKAYKASKKKLKLELTITYGGRGTEPR